MADSIMVEQVICNLVRNAVEAMTETRSQRREILIRTVPHDGDIVEIEVVDTGPGIDETIIDHGVRPVLHHQDGRRRHGAVHQPLDRRVARRQHPRRVARRRRHLPFHLAGHTGQAEPR
ncbi:MAG: ATP-binding protein [Rhodocyclaceae bacterium]|nr:ATP-binding protein [Rhodocyclaceae bacterium]